MILTVSVGALWLYKRSHVVRGPSSGVAPAPDLGMTDGTNFSGGGEDQGIIYTGPSDGGAGQAGTSVPSMAGTSVAATTVTHLTAHPAVNGTIATPSQTALIGRVALTASKRAVPGTSTVKQPVGGSTVRKP